MDLTLVSSPCHGQGTRARCLGQGGLESLRQGGPASLGQGGPEWADGRGRASKRTASAEPRRVGFDAWGAAKLAWPGLTAGHRSSRGLRSGPAMVDAARGGGSRDGRGGGVRQGETGVSGRGLTGVGRAAKANLPWRRQRQRSSARRENGRVDDRKDRR